MPLIHVGVVGGTDISGAMRFQQFERNYCKNYGLLSWLLTPYSVKLWGDAA